jgi:short-subunit dehydrogenase
MTAPTAPITGASAGIGYELAKLFARDQYNLVLVARNRNTLQQFATELRT